MADTRLALWHKNPVIIESDFETDKPKEKSKFVWVITNNPNTHRPSLAPVSNLTLLDPPAKEN